MFYSKLLNDDSLNSKVEMVEVEVEVYILFSI